MQQQKPEDIIMLENSTFKLTSFQFDVFMWEYFYTNNISICFSFHF